MKAIPCSVFLCEERAAYGAIWRYGATHPVLYYCREHKGRMDKAVEWWHIGPCSTACLGESV